ncbi:MULTISPECIES: response regulator transcription factor [unclassified Sporosarcina]|uniref:response regulator transcription factor n=1 Tax=unclassified Sporosarcina TaxID=2647733 RepID=UPI00203E942D|nr:MULTISPECIES: helix-turn-helix transcriptional regulator [unclassified Sporosarcina]GKV67360.1 hypothetical protein NCCP2331_35130 [Sporosarcina sp. NCCP-2331]GLB57716.1 hypothetical protein NCCP2378_35060 [Sporosarcina sp. NCCP-2378]
MVYHSLNDQNYEKTLYLMDELSKTTSRNFREDVLLSIKHIFGFNQSIFWLFDGENKLHDPYSLSIDASITSNYLNHYLDMDHFAPHKLSQMIPRQRVINTFDIITKEKLENSIIYHEYLKKYGFDSFTAIFLVNGNKLVGVLDLIFANKEEVPTKSELMYMEILSRFLVQKMDKHVTVIEGTGDRASNPLTAREKEVLLLIKQGYPNKEIAETLFISVNTVKKHIQSLYQKFEVNNRTQLSFKLTSNF